MTSFFEQNYVWQVYFEEYGDLATITLSYRRDRGNGLSIQFDDDPSCILNLAADEDDRLIMDGFLALIPDAQLLSCAMLVRKPRYLIWGVEDYKHIFAAYNKHVVRSTFNGHLFNTDGTGSEMVFIGGDRVAHTTSLIKEYATKIEQHVLRTYGAEHIAAWVPILNTYTSVIYTLSTEVHMVMRNQSDLMRRARQGLNKVASRYGVILPPEHIGEDS